LGFAVEMLGAVQLGDTTVSSTRIREAILGGDLRRATALLGRPYNLSGEVVPGHHRGVSLGYPTANLRPNKELLPKNGIYAVWVILGDVKLPGVLSIGCNPTFADPELSVEVHILNFSQEIYGKTLEVLFIERLRDEIRFAGREALIAQIDRDVARAREILWREDTPLPPS
jgi:riboflavin kinase/FMN adenylyltransferase